MNEKEEIKLRYNSEEMAILKKNAELLKKNINQYQIDVSKRAEVKIEVGNE